MSMISKWLNREEQGAAVQTAEPTTPKRTFGPLGADDKARLEEEIVAALKTCYDPEIPVDIYELGLIYDIDIDKERFVTLQMTLTSPGCPVAGSLPGEVERKVAGVEGVLGARVELVWEPPWTMSQMSEEARLDLGFF
jgi:FeS assembly SUF system protein